MGQSVARLLEGYEPADTDGNPRMKGGNMKPPVRFVKISVLDGSTSG